jgi:hypothetical protein
MNRKHAAILAARIAIKATFAFAIAAPHPLSAQTYEEHRQIMSQCRAQLEVYGRDRVNSCVKENTDAVRALQSYPKEYQQIVERCMQRMQPMGYAAVKSCADEDIATYDPLHAMMPATQR